MDDAPAPTPNESTASMLNAFTTHLPGLMRVIASNILPYEQAKLESTKAVSPEYTKLQTDLYGKYGPQLAAIGNEINRLNELAQISTDTAGMKEANTSLLPQVIAGQEMLDPGARAAREASANKLTELMNSLNPTGLSGGERAEVERSLARDNAMGGNVNPSAMTTVGNAMTFGKELQNKQSRIAGALQSAAALNPSLKSGPDAFQVATGRSSSTNTGIPQFVGNTQTGQDTKELGTNMFNQIGQNTRSAMDINANRRDTLDRLGQINNLCCWIFLESYYGNMPWWVRRCRDAFYTPERRQGYKLMAKYLVPLMRKYAFIRMLVNDIIVGPLTIYGGYLYRVEGYEDGRRYEGYTKFWFKTWEILGRLCH